MLRRKEKDNMYAMYKKVKIPETKETVGTGWLPPLPDLRDYTIDHPEIAKMSERLRVPPAKTEKAIPSLSAKVDLRQWCSPIESQMELGSCTAQAAVGVVEYFERRAFGKHIDGSRLFVYKTTRNLMGVTGDTGAWVRNAMGALVLCGVPPEKYWPYTDAKPDFDQEPSSFVYAVAGNYKTARYFCHNPLGMNISTKVALRRIKLYLAAGIPSMFGFFGFPSFDWSNVEGGVPYPCTGEQAVWGHAVVAVGYDDGMEIKNTECDKETKGALLFRNSWGTGWGDEGYGWIPYDYVLDGLALDFWSLLRMEWVDTEQFGL